MFCDFSLSFLLLLLLLLLLLFKGVPGFYGFDPRSFITSFIFGSLRSI